MIKLKKTARTAFNINFNFIDCLLEGGLIYLLWGRLQFMKGTSIKKLTKNIINLIPSESLKDEIIKTKFKVKDMDLVYIVDRYALNIIDKINYLNELLKENINNEAKDMINKILKDIVKAKVKINDDSIVDSGIYDEYRNPIWEKVDDCNKEDCSIKLVLREYKPTWPIFLNKFDLVKVKPYFDKDNYHYGFITNFQEESVTSNATICLFEDLKESDINSFVSNENDTDYLIPYNYNHDHIAYEEIEKVSLESVPENIKNLYLKIMDSLSKRVDISEFIYSKELRTRLKDHTFSDVEKACIVELAFQPFDKKVEVLNNICSYTNNYELFKQIKFYLEVMDKHFKKFKLLKEKEFYELSFMYGNKYYYENFNDAYEKGMEISKGMIYKIFQIKKIKFGTLYYNYEIYVFNEFGKVMWSNEPYLIDYEDYKNIFYNAYIDLPNIFKGDDYKIIRSCRLIPEIGMEDYKILSKDNQSRFDFRNNLKTKGIKLNITDVGPYVYFISQDGEVLEDPYVDFVNMEFISDNEKTLEMMFDLEYLKRGDEV